MLSFFLFCLFVLVLGPGIERAPHQWPKTQQWQCWIINCQATRELLIPKEGPYKWSPWPLQSSSAASVEASSSSWSFQISAQPPVPPWVPSPVPADLQASLCWSPDLTKAKLVNQLAASSPREDPCPPRLWEAQMYHRLHPTGASWGFHWTICEVGGLKLKWFFASLICEEIIIPVKSFLNSNFYPLTIYWKEVARFLSRQH